MDTEVLMPRAVLSCSVVSDSATPWTIAHQAPLSMEFSRQEHWSGFPCPHPGESSQPRDWTRVSSFGNWFPYHWAILVIGKTCIAVGVEKGYMVSITTGKRGLSIYYHKTRVLGRASGVGSSISSTWTKTSACPGSVSKQPRLPLCLYFY